jgi:hypothetical protein
MIRMLARITGARHNRDTVIFRMNPLLVGKQPHNSPHE